MFSLYFAYSVVGFFSKVIDDLTAKFLLLIFAALLLILSACGAQPPATLTQGAGTPRITPTRARSATPAAKTSTPVPTSSLGIDAGALEGIEITLWHPWSGELGGAIQDSIAAFNAENPYGIAAQGVYQGDFNDLYATVDTAAPEALPHLVIAYTYQVRVWDAGGKPVADLNPYVEDPQWGLTAEERSDFYPVFFAADVGGEKRYGFPIQRNAQVLYYNTSWARELGFDSPPETPAEFKRQACSAAQANNRDEDASNDGTGGWVVNTSPASMLGWLYAFGGEALAPGDDRYRFNTSQAEEMVAFLNDMLDSACAWESDGPYTETEFATRKALFRSAPLADHPYQNAEMDRAGNADLWSVIPFPSPEERQVITVYGPALALFQGSPEEELAAWLLIKWLVEPEQQSRIIPAGSSLPLRISARERLGEYAAANPQWSQALDLLDGARPEPNLASWSVVRWVVSDVGTQIFRYYFTLDRTQATLELMDETANELNARFSDTEESGEAP